MTPVKKRPELNIVSIIQYIGGRRMKGKRYLIFVLLVVLMVLFSFCNNNTPKILSMEDVRNLAEQGEELSWEDFDGYSYEDIGSGLYIRKYDIDNDYYVLVGGGSMNTLPMYTILVKINLDRSIDIRHDDIDTFINN